MKTKACTKCGEEKPLKEFNVSRRNKCGRRAECRVCQKASSRKYQLENKERWDARYREQGSPKQITKVCTKCGEEKSGNDFNKAKRYEDGLQFWCRACMKANREANKEKSLARVLALQEKNKGMKTKVCPKCKEEKPIDAFNKCRSKKDGLNSHCTACKKAHDATTKDQRAAQKKIYNEKNKKQIAAHKKAYYEANIEAHSRRAKEYRKENGEKLNKQRRERYAENGEHEKKKMSAYYKKNWEKVRKQVRQHYQENRKELLARAKEWKAIPENAKKIRDAIESRHRCCFCFDRCSSCTTPWWGRSRESAVKTLIQLDTKPRKDDAAECSFPTLSLSDRCSIASFTY